MNFHKYYFAHENIFNGNWITSVRYLITDYWNKIETIHNETKTSPLTIRFEIVKNRLSLCVLDFPFEKKYYIDVMVESSFEKE